MACRNGQCIHISRVPLKTQCGEYACSGNAGHGGLWPASGAVMEKKVLRELPDPSTQPQWVIRPPRAPWSLLKCLRLYLVLN